MRLSYEVLDSMLASLDGKFLDGQIELDVYLEEFDALIEFAGYTSEQFREEVDKRWGTKRAPQAFLC